ncbi:MAG: CotH kinase family protein [Clostridia bacterium]|nr:CotH kinase family protein [Clostridia bacterium]
MSMFHRFWPLLVCALLLTACSPEAPASSEPADVSLSSTSTDTDTSATASSATKDGTTVSSDSAGTTVASAPSATQSTAGATSATNKGSTTQVTTTRGTTVTQPPVTEEATVYLPVDAIWVEAEHGSYPASCQVVDTLTGRAVGHTSSGNIYTFDLQFSQGGYYLLSYTMAVNANVTLTFAVNGENAVTLKPEKTNDWNGYRTYCCTEPIYIPKGPQTVTFTQHNSGINFDSFSLLYLAENGPQDLPLDRQVKATFTGDKIQAGTTLPIEVTGLKSGEAVQSYTWHTAAGFCVTKNRLQATTMSAVEMSSVTVWPVVKLDGKTYYLTATHSFTVPTYDPLPVIRIDTDGGASIKNKEDYVGADMTVTANGVPAEQLYDGTVEIRGRGNSTWNYPKKPYKLKLDDKTDLFGMGANKHWVLLANYRDRALTRNKLAFAFSEHLGLNTTSSVFVRLVLNGQDMGVYELCEHIRVGSTRVDIFDWEDAAEDETDLSSLTAANGYDTTGGFILEINGYYDEVSKFTTDAGVPITVKAPEYLNTNDELFGYAKKYIQDFEDAVHARNFRSDDGRHYSELFDVEDLVNYWLLNEFMGNLDSGSWSSTYIYKDVGDDLFHMGPAWDYDSSAGNYLDHSLQCPADEWVKTRQGKWYTQLYRDREFVEKLYTAYWANRDYLDTLVIQAETYYATLYSEALTDHTIWSIPTTYEYDGHLLVDWLRDRLAFMDRQFATVDKAYTSLNR